MSTSTINQLRENLPLSVIVVTLSLFGLLIPYSLLLGWNLLTSFLFWFILVPLISILSSRFYNKVNRSWITGIAGCVVFYLVIVFLIYSHYQTDLFNVMIVSSLSSVFMIWLLDSVFLRRR